MRPGVSGPDPYSRLVVRDGFWDPALIEQGHAQVVMGNVIVHRDPQRMLVDANVASPTPSLQPRQPRAAHQPRSQHPANAGPAPGRTPRGIPSHPRYENEQPNHWHVSVAVGHPLLAHLD